MDELDDDEEFDRRLVNTLEGCMPLILRGLAELRAQGAWTLRGASGRLDARLDASTTRLTLVLSDAEGCETFSSRSFIGQPTDEFDPPLGALQIAVALMDLGDLSTE